MTNFYLEIKSIPHPEQRYDTAGDYVQYENLATEIYVSRLASRSQMYLVVIHELVELALCERRKIGMEEIDDWDMGEGKDSLNPGDDPKAPYHREHVFAENIERLVAAELGIEWAAYCRAIDELEYRPRGRPPLPSLD